MGEFHSFCPIIDPGPVNRTPSHFARLPLGGWAEDGQAARHPEPVPEESLEDELPPQLHKVQLVLFPGISSGCGVLSAWHDHVSKPIDPHPTHSIFMKRSDASIAWMYLPISHNWRHTHGPVAMQCCLLLPRTVLSMNISIDQYINWFWDRYWNECVIDLRKACILAFVSD